MKTAAQKIDSLSPWLDNFRAHSITIGFKIGLSRAMCEYLSAVADGVHWNRSTLGAASPDPDNWIATGLSLARRGLIERKGGSEIENTIIRDWNWCHWRLTPAGVHIVELLKLTGMFIESDTAILNKQRSKQ